MKVSSPFLVPIVTLAFASAAQASQAWTPGEWKTIAAYDAETKLLERGLASDANYDSDVTKRVCFDRILALQEHIIDDAQHEYAYFVMACEAKSGRLGQCTNFGARDPSCTHHDIDIVWNSKTNTVRVANIRVSFLAGGRLTPPSVIPTTRPPSASEATPAPPVPTTATPSTSTSTAPPLAMPAVVGPATAAPTPTTTPTPTPTPASTVLALPNTTTADVENEPTRETIDPVPTKPTPTQTTTAKSVAAVHVISGVAVYLAVVAGAITNPVE